MSDTIKSISLKTKIAGIVLLLFFASFWLLTFSVEKKLAQDMTRLLETQQLSTVSYVASDLDDKFRQRIELLETNTRIITPELIADPEKAREFLKSRFGLLALFKGGLSIISKDGIGITDYPIVPERANASFRELDYFKEVVATGKTAIGKPRTGRFTRQPGVAFAAPIKDTSGKLNGLLVGFALFSDSTLFGQVEHANVGKTGYIAINVPQYNLIATSSNPARKFQPMEKPGVNTMLDRFRAGYEGSGIAVNSLDIETLTSAKSIPSTGWFAQIVLPTEEAFAPIRTMRKRAYSLAAGLSLFVLITVWLVIRRLLAPLSQASKRVSEMSSGELQTIPVKYNDEIGLLLTNFNTLVSEHKRNREQINQLAFYDALTNLPNRRLLLDRFNHALVQAKRFQRSLAIMYLDIDDFKQVNDTLGHDIGDELLKVAATRLHECVRGMDTVCRQGGDEFIIVLPEISHPQDAAIVAEKIIKVLHEPVSIHEYHLNITTSIGIAIYPVNGTDNASELMKKADMAMYEVKNRGKNGFAFYKSADEY